MKGFLNKDERQIIYRKLHPADWEIWRVAHNPRYRPNLDIEYIVKNGYLDIIAWIDYDPKIYEYAIKYEQLEILGWLKDKGYCFKISDMIFDVTQKGSLQLLQWMKDNLSPFAWPFWMWQQAAYDGHLDILKWNIVEWEGNKRSVRYFAQQGGHQHILDWLATLPIP